MTSNETQNLQSDGVVHDSAIPFQEGETSDGVDAIIHHEEDQYQKPRVIVVPPPPPPPPLRATHRRPFSTQEGETSDGIDAIIHHEEHQYQKPRGKVIMVPPPHPLRATHRRPFSKQPCSLEASLMFRNMYKTHEREISSEKEFDSSNSSCIISINEEEINSYITSNVKEKFVSLDEALVMEASQPKIQKVPLILSENTNFKKYYDPRMVSIGPYHHDSPKLKMMEKLKLQMVIQFIKNHRLSKEVLYSKIKKNIKVLRKLYEEEVIQHLTDDELAWMFFLDGCTILHYIYCATEEEDKGQFQKLKIKPDCLTFVQHDFFLLENQLPYQVLKLLISCLSTEDKERKFINSIEEFIFYSIKSQWNKHEKPNHKLWQNEDPAPAHLLDLLRTRIIGSVEKNPRSYSMVQQPFKSVMGFMSEPLEKIKDVIEYIGKALENFASEQTEDFQFFRNVEELKAAGIRLKPNNRGCLTDISFNLGTLRIHPIKVDDTTASMLLNLIAYEMSPDFSNNFEVSSYIAFLDALIDRSQDVKELRDKQILRNLLGSDEEVAKLFNEISTNIVPNPKKYSGIKNDIQKRYNNKWMTWVAQLNHQYFQSPWSLIAFLAAIIVVALTVIQTVYTILGYYQQKKT